MAATFHFGEDNDTQTGSPAHGTTRSGIGNSTYATDVNWKNADDCTANSGTVYSSAPIVASTNSFTKFTYGIFSGSFNLIENCKWSAHTAPGGSLDTGITLKGTVTSTYATPSTTTNTALTTDFTTAVAIGSGLTVDFSTTGPQDASPTSTLATSGYTQYLATQLQVSGSASPGDLSSAITTTVQYDES